MNSIFLPNKQGLYDPRFEHDSCGVGFIVNIKGVKSHKIISDGITMLEHLTHRGACGCDPKTGDGAGILIQMPDEFFRKECSRIRIQLPPAGDYGAGLVFLPTTSEARNQVQQLFEQVVREEGQVLLGWRDVPHDSSNIGYIARGAEPDFRHVFIGRGASTPDQDAFERKLYVIRKRMELTIRQSDIALRKSFYICSLSSRTIVHKGQLMAGQLKGFFKDFDDPTMTSALAMIHSRYSNNTFPT
jgi:glutamate synthase domain-containing protein 1